MRYAILGTTQALRDDGTPATLAGGRLRALLTALALRPGRVLSAEALIDEVWDGDPPAGPSGALQALVGRLRRALGHDAVGSVDGGYRLAAAPDDVDLYRFERLADEGARALSDGDPVKASGLLGDALALWRGPALADLPDRGSAALRSEARRLDVRRLRLTAELDLGRAGQILPELAELAAAHPLDEPLHALHIRSLRAAGRTADALTAYESVRRALADGLGADPSPELRSLHAELLNPDPAPGPSLSGSSGRRRDQAVRTPGNARARLTSFVGREAELNAVRGDLERARLVTITGPGGTGKTRLSQETGDLIADRWPDGVWYVELAPVSDPRTLPEAVISSLGLRETLLRSGSAAEAALSAETKQKDPARQLADYCANRRMLLVLDNCEHVIAAAATLAERLLADCPELSVLATSREPLGVPGELVRPLDPLPDPTALRLLADRGASARPGFSVEEDPAACAELCRRLDGLPLAIELAAARLRSLSPRQLADRLDDRFRLLTGGARTLLPRQQTLRAVVDWSWDLLEPAERVLLRRLAVFRGGWTLEAVEAVCADPDPHPGPDRDSGVGPGLGADRRRHSDRDRDPDPAAPGVDRIAAPDVAALLASLVDKSLVLADQTDDGTRCRMLETISEYAAGRLDESGERPAVERRHLTYFREYVRLADARLRGAGQLLWFERLEREHENLRAALRRAVDAGDEQEALILVLGCSWFWEVRNYLSERRYWPAVVAAMGPDPFDLPPALAPVERGPLEDPPPLEGERLTEARRWVRVVDLTADEGEKEWWTDPRLAKAGRALIENYPPHLPQSARFPGLLRVYGAFFSGEFDQMHRLTDESVAACRSHGRTWELAWALQMRAKINDISERLHGSLRDIRESRTLFEQLGDEWGVAETLSGEAEAANNSGDWPRAIVCCREGIALARKIGSHHYVPVLTVRMGDALVKAGQPEEGERMLREGIRDAERFGIASDGSALFGRVLLVGVLGRRDIPAALALVDETIASGTVGTSGVPDFVNGILRGVKGTLVGKAGDPEGGLRMISEGLGALARSPLVNVITPRLAILLSPGAIELLTMLATAAPPGDPRADLRAHRAAALVGAHDRLRPTAVAPDEQRDIEACVARLRARFGDAAYEAGYAEGDGLSLGEAVALIRDVD